MKLNLLFVTGLVCVSGVLAASSFDIPLQRQISNINLESADSETTVAYIKGTMMKYANAMQNYKRNTGKDHPLAVKSNDKRDDTSVSLTPVAGANAWRGEIMIGGQKVPVDFDTGSADLIVNPGAYDPNKSDSSVDTHKNFHAAYGDKTEGRGREYRDTVKLGDATAKKVSVGRTNDQFLNPKTHAGIQGIVGLSFPSISVFRKNDDNAKSLNEVLGQSDAISHNVYQFTLKQGDGSQLHIGDVDESKIKNYIVYVDVQRDLGFWVTDAKISGLDIRVVIDSGTSMIVGPVEELKKVFHEIGDMETISKNGMVYGAYDCDRDLGVTFNIAGKKMRIPKKLQKFGKTGDGRCILSLVGLDKTPLHAWVIGDTLFQGNTIVFDVDKPRLGFATANE